MVNHRNISAGESRCRVQLASLSLGEIYAASQPFPLLCRPRAEIGIYNITKYCSRPNILVGSWTFSLLTTTVSQSVVRLSPLFTNILVRLRACGLTPISWWQFSSSHNLKLGHVLYHKALWHPAWFRSCLLHTCLPQFIGRFYFGLAHTISSSLASRGQLW